MHHRQTVLGLVGRTATWPTRVAGWASAGAMPCRIAYCPSVAHLQARLAAAATPQGVLLDGDLSLVDRDLLADISRAGGDPIVVEGSRRHLPWQQLGATAILPQQFTPDELEDALRTLAPSAPTTPAVRSGHGRLVAVTGPGGSGASVTAIALAQGLAAGHRRVVLVDCCLHAEQAMLHNAQGPHPGLTDLVDMHSERTPERHRTRQLALGIVERGYYLLPGLARARHWSRIRPGSLEPALRSLRTAFDVVVADADADVEGEAQGGSLEVEERNLLARTVTAGADAVLVVGQPTMKGVYALVRTMVELLDTGVEPERLLPIVNQADEHRATRARLGRVVTHLMDGVGAGGRVRPVLFAPVVDLEDRLRERDALPPAWPALLAGAVTSMLTQAGADGAASATGQRVAPGSLGHWDPEPAESS